MLVLSRRVGEGVLVGSRVSVVVLRVGRGQVALGVDAPRSVRVQRGEVCTRPGSDVRAMIGGSGVASGASEMLDDLRRLMAFTTWANRRALESLRAMDAPPARAVGLLAHVVEAERVWIDRFDGVSADAAPWPERTLDEIEGDVAELEGRWAAYFASVTEAGLRESFGYRNTSGAPFESEPADVLLHLALHAQEHRGQIGLLVGEAGGTWEETQYAWWRRGG